MTYRISLQSTIQLTHDTHYYVFSKPKAYAFTPGQATDLALDQPGWREEARPFTFVSAPSAEMLAFVIKSYPDRDGVTARLPDLRPGDTVLIKEAWGAIEDRGPGVFIAAGAGITPFIPILQRRAQNGALQGCTLLYANHTEADVILQPYWAGLSTLRAAFPLSKPESADMTPQKIDAAYLKDHIDDVSQLFYLCGPEGFERSVAESLSAQGVPDDRIIREG